MKQDTLEGKAKTKNFLYSSKTKLLENFFLQQLSFIEKTLGEISQRKQP